MMVFSNHRLGPAVELMVSGPVATTMLRQTAAAASTAASSRWEHELVRWLEDRASRVDDATGVTDVSEIAWSPEYFDRQRHFVLDAIARAAGGSSHSRVLLRWAQLIAAHPRDSVQFGRRWVWQPSV